MPASLDERLLDESLTSLVKRCQTYEISIDDGTVTACRAFARLLAAANESRNLTRLVDAEGAVVGLFLDSLLFLRHLEGAPVASLIDVGSGAGFPAVPLAAARPGLRVVAMDSRKMKMDFLAEAATAVPLPNLTAIHGRAEELALRAPHAGAYDMATARALGSLAASVGFALPFVRPGGRLVVARGSRGYDEALREARGVLKDLGGVIVEESSYRLPGYDSDFLHVVVERRRRAR